MKKQFIRDISLGPKQIPLGFEDDLQEQSDTILSFINVENERNGAVILEDIVTQLQEAYSLSEFNILQTIFRLARDLKIHFRVNGKDLMPHLVKKALLDEEPPVVEIATGKKSDSVIFNNVIRRYSEIFEEKDVDEKMDQYEFSKQLTKKIKICLLISMN